MTPLAWTLFALLLAATVGAVAVVQLRREAAVPGRALLVTLRALALGILLLLLFDPHVDLPGPSRGAAPPVVVVDRSLSMALPAGPGAERTRWEAALAVVEELGASSVLVTGDAGAPISLDSLRRLDPAATDSRVSPAVRAAVEAGARRLVVITDRRLEDAAEIGRWLPGSGATLEVRDISEPLADRWIAEVRAPVWAQPDRPVALGATLAGAGAAGDSVAVVVRRDGAELARRSVAVPPAGRTLDVALEAPPPRSAAGGWARYEVALEGSDPLPDDDVRTVYVRVAEEPAGVALVSFRPDWEPRFLLPALAQATGLPARGWLRLAGGRWVSLERGAGTAAAVSEAAVRRAAAGADLLVLHGLSRDAPAWAQTLAARGGRVLVFPGEALPAGALPVQLPAGGEGEWYVTAEPPASPVAPLLEGVPADSLPPLTRLRPVRVQEGLWAPLAASRARRGPPAPVLVAGERPGGRWALALGEGYWRWAFRPGAPRETYRRLWSAVAGWLLAGEATAEGEPIRPRARVLARGAPLVWLLPGLDARALEVVLEPLGDAPGTSARALAPPPPAADSLRVAVAGDSAAMPAPPPGRYRWRARAIGADASAGGELTVERFTPELVRARVELPTGGARPGAESPARGGRPLRATPWPWLLVVGLLCAEWILRRRRGLR